MPEKTRVHIFVSGKVQGVFFREKTRRLAEALGLTGWARNLPDGRVEIIAEGEKEKIEEILEFARRGSKMAKVDGIEVEWQEFRGEFKNFDIKFL